MQEQTLLHKSASSRVFETANGQVLKIVEEKCRHVYPNYLFCQHHTNHPNILSPLDVQLVENEVHILMEKASPLTKIEVKRLLRDILDALCYFERYGLVYGDIKPDNIVEYENRYCLIDFDLLVPKDDHRTLTQTFNDIYGCALRADLRHPNYNNFHQALYALAITAWLVSETSSDAPNDKPSTITPRKWCNDALLMDRVTHLSVQGLLHEVFVSTTAREIHENAEIWIRHHFSPEYWSFLGSLVGAQKFTSFQEVRNHPFFRENHSLGGTPDFSTKQYSRDLYDLCMQEEVTLQHAFLAYHFFYSYLHLVSDEADLPAFLVACLTPHTHDYNSSFAQLIYKQDCGFFITLCTPVNLEARLLLEYLTPGSWKTNTLQSLEEVLEFSRSCETLPTQMYLAGRVCPFSESVEYHSLESTSFEELDAPEEQ